MHICQPTVDIRNLVSEIAGNEDFLEIFMSTPLEVCESRDLKGLYQKARAGVIKNFTGISAPFEIPKNAVLSIDTSTKSVEECVNILLNKVLEEITITE